MPSLRDGPGLSPLQGVIFAIVMAFAFASFSSLLRICAALDISAGEIVAKIEKSGPQKKRSR